MIYFELYISPTNLFLLVGTAGFEHMGISEN